MPDVSEIVIPKRVFVRGDRALRAHLEGCSASSHQSEHLDCHHAVGDSQSRPATDETGSHNTVYSALPWKSFVVTAHLCWLVLAYLRIADKVYGYCVEKSQARQPSFVKRAIEQGLLSVVRSISP
jgi:hypothetical protein